MKLKEQRQNEVALLSSIVERAEPPQEVRHSELTAILRAFEKIAQEERTLLRKQIVRKARQLKVKWTRLLVAFFASLAAAANATTSFVVSWAVRHRTLLSLVPRLKIS